MHRPPWTAVFVACLGLSSLAAVPAADPPARKIFADEAWYQSAEGKEQTFEGTLEKAKSPGATSGRWNPVRLVIDDKLTREVYLGADTKLLDGHLGRRVRIEGKSMEVLGPAEIWPARIKLVARPEDPPEAAKAAD